MKSLEPIRSYRGAAAFALVLTIALSARSAQAETVIAGDLDYAIPVNSDADSGVGFGVRIGQQLRVPPLIDLTPEMAFTYHDFSSGPLAYRGLLGLRLGFGEILRPGVFAHLGIGRLVPPGPAPSHTAFSYDAGAFLDFTLIPLVNLGAHVAYNRLNSQDTSPGFSWATVGIHAALVF